MEIVSVNISDKKGEAKLPVSEMTIDESGAKGDAHAGAWHRQISILSMEIITGFEKKTGRKTGCGEFGENITVQGIDLDQVSILDRFRAGTVELEVSQIGKKCHGSTCSIFKEVGTCVMPNNGLFCRVIRGGKIKSGDELTYNPRPLRIKVITLSDRSYQGIYEDRSGPFICETLKKYFEDTRWHLEVNLSLIPDNREMLTAELVEAEKNCDVIITSGGTGVGPNDITPDVVAEYLDRDIPGIMEHIRTKYGADNPNALLSRSIAGIKGQTQIYTLPGSVRAAEEYLTEILKTVEHLLLMAHSLDIH